jgi:hypothetical protein
MKSNCAWLFVPALLLFFAAMALGGFIENLLGDNFPAETFSYFVFFYVVPGIGLVLAALIWQGIHRARARRAAKFAREQLSRDELSKARSKLRNETKPVRPSALRGPDTDLKY